MTRPVASAHQDHVRVTPDTLAKVHALAEMDGVSVSEFARRALLGAAGGR